MAGNPEGEGCSRLWAPGAEPHCCRLSPHQQQRDRADRSRGAKCGPQYDPPNLGAGRQPRGCSFRNASSSRITAKSPRAWSACRWVRRRSGSSISGGGARMSLAMDYPSPQRDRANLSRNGSTLRPSRRGDHRSERTSPSANRQNGPAIECGANRVHNRRSQARSAPRPRVRQRAL